ncbi:MAG: PAS domain S-box protein, partial [Cellulophaga sp.]|nr:PAS domain S-box protein [Cellulophaga sp.]
SEKSSEIDGIFINIIDPYIVMDLFGNIIKMNESAKEFLGYCSSTNPINLSTLVHEDYIEYTYESFKKLMEVGAIKNYRVKLVLNDGIEKIVEVNGSLIYDEDRNPVGAQGVIRDISQETEIKNLLAEQKKQLDIIVENSPIGIVLTDNNKKIIKANNTFLNLIGYSIYDLKKITLDDISEETDIALAESFNQKINSGEIDNYSIVKKFIKKDGAIISGKTTISAVKTANGLIDYRVALIEDITKEKEAEEKLKASEDRLSSLIANLHTGILVEDQNRKIALTNKIFCDLFKVKTTPEKLKGFDCVQGIENSKELFKNPDEAIERINKIVSDKKLVLADVLEMADGRVLERDYIPVFKNNVYNGHLWAYNDVTIAKNYKKNLEIQKEKYSSIIANMNLGLVEVDNDDVIQMVNQSFCTLSGYPEDQLINKKALDVVHIINKSIIQEKSVKRLNGESDSYEVEILHPSGEVKHWLISGAPRYDEYGKVIGSLGIHLDITKQKELELQKEKLVNELETSNHGLQEYAHIVSHDLKSPLRSISALCTWLNEDYQDKLDDNGKYNLTMMQEKVEAMDSLIDGILKYSTISSDNVENTSVDVNEVIKEITDIIFIPEHVKIVTTSTLPTLFADRTKIHQLIQNFLSNAVVHIEREEGLVEIGCEDRDTYWEFSIKDNGVGIPKEYHEKIFKIFQSVGNKERSTGIGLSIVKKIIDLYQGKVWLESEIGLGTTFFFTLKK